MADSSTYFIDTSFFKALVDAEDEFHKKAATVWKDLGKGSLKFVTTNYVLDESFTLIRVRCGIRKVDEFRKLVSVSSKELRIVRVTIADEARAWDWFLNDWSGLSFTDCISFSVMRRLKIGRVLTFDNHFKRAGFDIVNK